MTAARPIPCLAAGAGGAGVAVIGYLADTSTLPFALRAPMLPVLFAIILFAQAPYPGKIAGRLAGNQH